MKKVNASKIIRFILLLCRDVGPTIEENIREHPEALISSVGPLLIQSKGTSEITLIAPCNGTGNVDLFTELKVFWKEKWTFAVGNFGPESYAHEGCSATMHKFVICESLVIFKNFFGRLKWRISWMTLRFVVGKFSYEDWQHLSRESR
jgi:hypothetical protein